MWQRFLFSDVRIIGHYLGLLLLAFTACLAVPLICALIFQEWVPATHYVLSAGISLTLGMGLRFLRIEPARLNRRQALAVTGLAWILLACVAAIPLYMSGHYGNFLDALFDGVSGITTTGASIISDLDHLSYADNMWRFTLHFVGGVGLIVVALSLGLFGRRQNASLFTSEARSEHVVPNVMDTTRTIAKISLVFIAVSTIVLSLICLFIGMDAPRSILQAFWLSITGFLTGGFAPMSQSVLYYHCFPLECVLMILMLFGSINFVLHNEIWKGRTRSFFRDFEIKTAVVWLTVSTVVFTASITATVQLADVFAILRRGLFMIVAAFSTTGLQNVTTNQLVNVFSSGAFLVIALLMAVGGGIGSTAGGIKINRIGIIFKSMVASIKESLSPESSRVVVSYYHLGRRVLDNAVVREAMAVFILYVSTYIIGTLVGIAFGYEATEAVFESIAMAANGGLVSTIVSPSMPPALEAFYIFLMWAGRLEFMTLLALMVEIGVSLIPRRFL